MKIPEEVESLYIALEMYEEDGDEFVASFYDSQAPTYDGFIESTNYTLAQNVANIAIQKIDNSSLTICIDIGCGTGAIGVELLKRQSNISLDGIDISEEMIKITSEKFEEIKKLSEQPLGPANEFIYKNLFIGNIKEENKELHNKYDVALSSGVFTKLHLGPEHIIKVLSTLKVGGFAVISVNSSAYLEQGYEEEIRRILDENIVKSVEIITVRQWGDDRYTETAEVLVMEKV